MLAAWRHRGRRDTVRAGSAPQSRRRLAAARRWVADVTLVCAAVGGLVILRQQGLPPPGSIDLFTAAAPVLVAIPAALLVMRGYPLVLRQLTRMTGRRRGVVMIVGLARGSAAAQAGVLPAFALVLAFAVAAFAGMARSAVAAANVAASWQIAGADATITAPEVGPGITREAQRAITGVPGVQRAAAVAVTTGNVRPGPEPAGGDRRSAQLRRADRRHAAAPFRAAALARPAAPQARVPVLVSPAARDIVRSGSSLYVAGRTMRVQVAGRPDSFLGVTSGSGFAVLPRWALGAQAPPATAMAVVGQRLDTAALIATAHRAVPGSQVTLRSQVLAGIAGAPLPHGGFVTFAQGAAAAAGLSLLVLALTLVLSARSREMTLARLATMGLGPAQSRAHHDRGDPAGDPRRRRGRGGLRAGPGAAGRPVGEPRGVHRHAGGGAVACEPGGDRGHRGRADRARLGDTGRAEQAGPRPRHDPGPAGGRMNTAMNGRSMSWTGE